MKVIKKEFTDGGFVITFENGKQVFFASEGLVK